MYPQMKICQFPNFKSVQHWWDNYDKKEGYQLDIETNIVDDVIERIIYTIQIGDLTGDVQLVFDIPALHPDMILLIRDILQEDCPKYIQNAMFEYTILKQYMGIEITQIKDTFIQSRVLTCGLPPIRGRNSLAGIVKRILRIDLPKEEQTTFKGELLTANQIEYAAKDVTLLHLLHKSQMKLINRAQLQNTLQLEEKVVPALGDLEVHGMHLDQEQWKIQAQKNKEELAIILDNMIEIMKTGELFEGVKELGFIAAQDTYYFKWSSPKQKLILLQLDIPGVTSSAMIYLKKYLKANSEMLTEAKIELIEAYLTRDYEWLETYYITDWGQTLQDMEIMIPEGSVRINFDSPAQTLLLFQLLKPNLRATDAKALAYIQHPLISEYKKYTKVSKAVTSFGELFLEGVSKDGKVRPRIKTILDTGRISMSSIKGKGSGLQQMPANNIYRNCFKADPGYKFVGIDYMSAELVIIAEWSQDSTMLKALREGRDLHSVTTSLLFPELWANAGEPSNPKKKPISDEGKKLRQWAKATSFGIVYGTSAVGLAERLDLPPGFTEVKRLHREAVNKAKRDFHVSDSESLKRLFNDNKFLPEVITGDKLIKSYFKVYPKVEKRLKLAASQGVTELHSRTMQPYVRARFFTYPDNQGQAKAIERQAANASIQGTSADITKTALIFLKRELDKSEWDGKLILQMHDEIVVSIREDQAEQWAPIQAQLMNDAADVVIKSGLLRVDKPSITDQWTK